MDINWPIVIIVAIAALVLIFFLNKRNQKDEKEMEDTMNQVEHKHPDHDADGGNKI